MGIMEQGAQRPLAAAHQLRCHLVIRFTLTRKCTTVGCNCYCM